jgi:hypothetical protein
VRDDYAILDRQLHTFQVDELQELRRVADTIFEPLMRPFRQKRTVQEFSFKQSIRVAQRIGAFMPAYEKVERSHRKSRLVIAMSLAGIDRCSAVSLIPLFSCLKESALDFNFYVYTDDLIKAEFTQDGFLANDHRIAWNHVNGPGVMQRLADLETESQEDLLLLIDSLGGGSSRWYEYWAWDDRQALAETQDKYLASAGKYSFYSRIRRELNGDFNKFGGIKKLPEEWLRKVRENTQERWMETPALEEYMIRWVFHPDFGQTKHGGFWTYQNAFETARKLRGKFRQIHLLTPNNQGSHRYTLDKLLATNVVDYHHRANTIYGFATVLANIVHGQCPFDGPYTRKVSYEIVKFSEFKGEEEAGVIDAADGEGDGEHTELRPSGKCFDNCPVVMPCVPAETTVKLERRPRGGNDLQLHELPINEVDLSDLLPHDMSVHTFWKDKILPYDFEIERGDSEYTRLRKAEEVLETIKKYHIVYKKGMGFHGLVREPRPLVSDAAILDSLLKGIEYQKHNTRSLQDDVEELLLTVAPAFHSYLNDLALKHVIWCGVSKYDQQRRAISVNPKGEREARRRRCYHELGHYLESTCPPVGAFSNELLKQKGGKFDKKKLVQVGSGGEYAMPVTNGSPDWIVPYAGKWYKRSHNNLPNDTEIVSVHLEYFTKTTMLAQLIKHDPSMVRFMAFVLMGGPFAGIKSIQELRRKEALDEIHQRERKASGYSSGRRGGGGGKGSRGGSYGGKVDHGYGL